MSDDGRRKKRSEKMSDAFAARLARENGPSTHRDESVTAARAEVADKNRNRGSLASMQTSRAVGFVRCPHCREYVPVREECRACGTPMS